MASEPVRQLFNHSILYLPVSAGTKVRTSSFVPDIATFCPAVMLFSAISIVYVVEAIVFPSGNPEAGSAKLTETEYFPL